MRFALFFFGREWEDVGNTRAFFNGIPLCAALETNGWSGSSLSLSICAASNENDAFVVHICPELVRVHRFLRPRAFVNFVIFWIIHKMIR